MASLTVGKVTSVGSPVTASANAVITSFPHNPLTTTFKGPGDCTGLYASNFLSGVDFATTCLPDGFDPNPKSYFSPGLICPSGYVSACHDNTGVPSITTVTCCPTVADNIALSCVDTKTLHSVWSTLFCTWIAPGGKGTSLPMTMSQNGVTSTPTIGFTAPGGLNAYGIRMVYEATDLETTKTKGLGTKSKIGSTPTTTNKNGSDPNSGGSSGMSEGAKIAIGVVVPIVVLGLLAGAFFWWRRKRTTVADKEKQGSALSELQGSNSHPTELPGQHPKPYNAVELPANPAS
ncbi:hypothetical protein PT974_08099 [Cladobotryum mycophilum]|uniref:Mid2 domain-containing protein n=1 Tax=Cladobotryum mycophilum TaxID=491253 RepID=A0ABR0SDC3_9HYPO